MNLCILVLLAGLPTGILISILADMDEQDCIGITVVNVIVITACLILAHIASDAPFYFLMIASGLCGISASYLIRAAIISKSNQGKDDAHNE